MSSGMEWINNGDIRTRLTGKFIRKHLGQGPSFNKVPRLQPTHSDLTKNALLRIFQNFHTFVVSCRITNFITTL